jgi:hypothetical protein
MNGQYILGGPDGRTPIKCESIEDWIEKARSEGGADRRVGLDMICGVRISTVFLSFDHNWEDEGEPLLFETMIFGGPDDEKLWRCSTWEQAERQHAVAVALVKRTFRSPKIVGWWAQEAWNWIVVQLAKALRRSHDRV